MGWRAEVETAFEALRGFGLQGGVADGGGVRVVEVDVGGQAEAVAVGGVGAETVSEDESGGG